MAYGDLSIFRPSDAQYSNPAQALTAVKGEATQRAAYLSSMDQFYAQMEEAGRQFDITTQQTREMFGEELAFKGKELQAQEKYWEEQIAFGREQLGSEQERWQAQLAEERRYHDQAFDLGKEELKLKQSALDLEAQKIKYDDPLYESWAASYGKLRGQYDYLGTGAQTKLPWQRNY